ncbi:KEOPS complex subunit Pcc1 [Halobacterium sp. R2-5]|uniref:KEOPS complex subunit Pcc1 n=1 Tax=Halobacterium sp. R2-5 TaxID=2715751 RepID=UPI00141E6F05|nr:KEOPS complex subunit Pcc1 [Halobacterium sp. R2-5]NIB99079.1 KEOPS complex Pcc1-like subunit [Halobacterium sp. R2-5]
MTRAATIRTEVPDPGLVAAAVRPDNTAEMDTRVEDGGVVTRIERDDTGGLQSTVDDYVVNVTVATEVAQHANRHTTHES